jgi:hypothetical protein
MFTHNYTQFTLVATTSTGGSLATNCKPNVLRLPLHPTTLFDFTYLFHAFHVKTAALSTVRYTRRRR